MSEDIEHTFHFEMGSELMTRHITAIKWIGVSFILITTISIPTLLSISGATHATLPLDYQVKVNHSNNQTNCNYVKRYDLGDGVNLTVCTLNGHIIFDIRYVLNQSTSRIPLTLAQLQTIKQVQTRVVTGVNQTQTYWTTLKRRDQ